MARWPWHKTEFYVEWLEQIAAQRDAEEEAEMKARLLEQIPAGAVTVDGLAGLGAQVRKA